jgi:hypothetical protein
LVFEGGFVLWMFFEEERGGVGVVVFSQQDWDWKAGE